MDRLLIAPLLLLAVCTLGAADEEARRLGPKEGSCLLLHGKALRQQYLNLESDRLLYVCFIY